MKAKEFADFSNGEQAGAGAEFLNECFHYTRLILDSMKLHEQRRVGRFVKLAIDLLCALDHLSSAVCASVCERQIKPAGNLPGAGILVGGVAHLPAKQEGCGQERSACLVSSRPPGRRGLLVQIYRGQPFSLFLRSYKKVATNFARTKSVPARDLDDSLRKTSVGSFKRAVVEFMRRGSARPSHRFGRTL
jgi:hypothetical protein